MPGFLRARVWLAVAILTLASCARDSSPRYKDPAQPIKARVADLVSRMTLEEKVAQLQAIWQREDQIQDAAGRFDPAHAPAAPRTRPRRDRRGRAKSPSTPTGPRVAHGARGGRVRQCRAEVGDREHAPRHSRDVPRRSAARARRAGRHLVSRADRARPARWDPALVERVMSVAAREARARGVAARALAGRRSRSRSALGTLRGDVRRGSVSRLAARRRGRPRLSRRRACRSRRTRSSRRSNTSPATARTKAASTPRPSSMPERLLRSELLVPFEAGGQGSRRLHRHAELQRGGRRAVARQSLAARGRAAPRVGLPGRSSSPTTTRSSSS